MLFRSSELNETNKEIEIRRSELNNIASKTEEINNKIVFEQENLRKQAEVVEEKSKGSNILRISLRII